MPGIGNPNSQNNPFNGIRKFQGQRPSSGKPAAAGKKDLGQQLDRIAGVQQDKFFVDKDKHNQMDKNAFLKLLSTQLQNQDPFKPVDQKKFAADLAQFSQLEQLANMNSKMDKTADKAPHEMKQIGASFLGKQVETTGTTLNYDGSGKMVSMPFFLPKAAKNVMVRIFDSSNNMTQQLEYEDMGRGQQLLSWDGESLDGKLAAKDTYRFEVRAWDKDFQQFKGETRAKGTVTGVSFDETGEVVLTVDGKKKVFLKDVKNFSLGDDQLKEFSKQKMGDATKMPALNKAAASAYNNISEQSQ